MTRRLLLLFWFSFAATLFSAGCAEPIQPELDVTPATDTFEAGSATPLTVTRRYPGGASRDVTRTVRFVSADDKIADVVPDATNKIVLTAISTGTTTIRVVDDENHVSANLAVTVVVPASQRIVEIEVIPSALVLPLQTTRQYVAQGRYADGSVRDVTRSVAWASERPEIAIVGTTQFDFGIVRTISNGQTRITATDLVSSIQGQSVLFVQGQAQQILSIVVTPNPAGPIAVGATQQFTASGFFANGTTQDISSAVTWESSATGTATIAPGGLATGVAVGQTTISAVGTDPSVRGSAAFSVQ